MGKNGAIWHTAVDILNPGHDDVHVTLDWLVRDQANPNPLSLDAGSIAPGETMVLDDVLLDFGIEAGAGAIRVHADGDVMVNGAVLNTGDDLEYGQSFEGIPVGSAIAAGSTTHVVGLARNDDYRTNVYLVEAAGHDATATVELLDMLGAVVGTKVYELGANEPVLEDVAALGGPDVFAYAALQIFVDEGSVIVGASRINEGSGDPLTLASWWQCGDGGGHDAHWGYCCGMSPAEWGYLGEENALCKDGFAQSPIDISSCGAVAAELPELTFAYGAGVDLDTSNNGHAVVASVASGDGTLTIGDDQYELLQFHFHTGSETFLDGQDFPIEMHMVHVDGEGNLAVVGVFFEIGEGGHSELADIFSALPAHAGDVGHVEGFDLNSLIPGGRTYRFTGSLTTPPCSEGVAWNVYATPLQLTQEEVDAFIHIFSGEEFPDGNRRPVQPLNGRVVQTEAN
ncbi:MAG: carbonic anhydrase family protein [bacterium]|nr:carbonic anhydrase family protein [bacterium]